MTQSPPPPLRLLSLSLSLSLSTELPEPIFLRSMPSSPTTRAPHCLILYSLCTASNVCSFAGDHSLLLLLCSGVGTLPLLLRLPLIARPQVRNPSCVLLPCPRLLLSSCFDQPSPPASSLRLSSTAFASSAPAPDSCCSGLRTHL